MGLRKGQKELVEQYRGGYCAIPAIPGGGKTHCLSLWAVEMIANGLHKPGKILIVTYMNSAVSNFKQRISRELLSRGISGSKDFFVSTIHGLCLQIIKEKPDLIGADQEFYIVDGMTKFQMVSMSIDEWRRQNEHEFRQFIEEAHLSSRRAEETCKSWRDKLCTVVQTSIGEFKSRGITPKAAKEKCRLLPESSILRCASEIYEIYDRKLKTSAYLDFDDMLYKAKKILEEDHTLLEKYKNRFSFVCEDEAQDSNLIQSEILSIIAHGNLLRVGDSNQAICGSFTNSDFRFFKEFCELPQTVTYNITQSSRNTRDIIDLANYFVKYVRKSHPVHECRGSLLPQYIEPVDDECPNPTISEYGIRLKVFDSWENEAGAVVTQACHMIKKHPDKTIAILIPTSWKINDVIRILESRQVPFDELDNSAKQRNKAINKLGRVIDFIAAPEEGEKLGLMFLECFLGSIIEDTTVKDSASEINKVQNQKQMLLEYLRNCKPEKHLYPSQEEADIDELPSELSRSKLWTQFEECTEYAKKFLEHPLMPVERLILFIAKSLRFDTEEMALAQKVADDARYMKQQNLQFKLSDLAEELLSAKNSFSHYAGVIWDLKGYEPKPGVVTICTYHKSKGLEWDIVFLTGLNYADFPVELNDKFIGEYWFLKEEYKNPQALVKADIQKIIGEKEISDTVLSSKLETISEKARLLYVGITRARRYLFLSGFHANHGKKNEIPASRYLIELKKYIDQKQMRG